MKTQWPDDGGKGEGAARAPHFTSGGAQAQGLISKIYPQILRTRQNFIDKKGKSRKSTAISDHLIRLVKLGLLKSNEKPKNERKYWMAGREAPAED